MNDSRQLILSIDDNKVNLKLTERFLEKKYRVVTTDSSVEGLKIAEESQPDLILLDIMMPEMDGYEACSLLQKNEKTSNIPVVFLTALDAEQDRLKAFSVGAAGYLIKPIRKNELLEMVEKHIKTKDNWDTLISDSSTWDMRLQPSDFIQFKEYLFEKFEVDAQARYDLAEIIPSDIYSIAEEINTTEKDLAKRIAEYLHLPFTDSINTDEIKLGVLPSKFCKNNNVVAVKGSDGEINFILSNPFNWDLIDVLKKLDYPGKPGNITIAEPANFLSLLNAIEVDTELKKAEPVKRAVTQESLDADIKERPVVHITNTILDKAVVDRASDIHIEPKEDKTYIRFRIDGDLVNAFTLKTETGSKVISRLKILGGLDIAEKRKPQDGGFATEIHDRAFNIRLSTTSTPYGESLVMRLLEPYIKPKKLTELGMSGRQTDTMIRMAGKHSGMILIVGTTGSGKTTTIYSLLNSVDCEKRSVLSVEDPVEYRIPYVTQQQVNEKAGITFEALLKTAVRQDPDVLFIGEMRDNFSAKVTVDFASTGHLTITTMHTSNATTAIFRLERLGITRSIIADTVLAVIAQRLMKKLCPNCKRIGPITKEEIEMLKPYTDEIPEKVANPAGCPKCGNTGYFGREGIYEILEFDNDIAQMVRENAAISAIRKFSKNRGDYLVSSHGLLKVKNLIFSPADLYKNILVEEVVDFKQAAKEEGEAEIIPASSIVVNQPSILIVEDDIDTRRLLERFLDKGGYNVTTTSDGIEALMTLGNNNYDLILSDINMPNLDGFKLLEMLNVKGITTPVVFLTSRAESEDIHKGLNLGALDYITKPIKKELLLLRVNNLLFGGANEQRKEPTQ